MFNSALHWQSLCKITPDITPKFYGERATVVDNIIQMLQDPEGAPRIVFTGPMGCGKSTTLYKIYQQMLSQSSKEVIFIDMKELTEKTTKVPEESFVFIDNAQRLSSEDHLVVRYRIYKMYD